MLRLTYRGSTTIPVEAECLTPDQLAGKAAAQIAALPVQHGNFPGVSMIAGSVFVFGQPGIRVGAGMKRGTIALMGPLPPLLPSFRFDCTYCPVFLEVYHRQLRAWGFAPAERVQGGRWRRYSGDLVGLGKGELLHSQPLAA